MSGRMDEVIPTGGTALRVGGKRPIHSTFNGPRAELLRIEIRYRATVPGMAISLNSPLSSGKLARIAPIRGTPIQCIYGE